jgi:uncharacterized protein involved in exopolysaccharide biosynthesis
LKIFKVLKLSKYMDRLQTGSSAYSESGGELDFDMILALLRARWKSLSVAFIVGGLVGFAFSFAFTPRFRADALLIPSEEIADTSRVTGINELGGLASLVGLNSRGDRKIEALATLKSRALTEGYVAEENLLPILFPHQWDAHGKAWRNSDPRTIPTPYDAYRLFDTKLRKVSEDRKTGLVTISVEWTDPALATKWTRDFVDRTNNYMRQKAIERSNRNLAFLNEQLDKSSVVELRAAIYKLIETEVKKIMVAQGSDDYAFRFVDPPEAPKRKVFPNRMLFLVYGAIIGFLGQAAHLYWRYSRRERKTLLEQAP